MWYTFSIFYIKNRNLYIKYKNFCARNINLPISISIFQNFEEDFFFFSLHGILKNVFIYTGNASFFGYKIHGFYIGIFYS